MIIDEEKSKVTYTILYKKCDCVHIEEMTAWNKSEKHCKQWRLLQESFEEQKRQRQQASATNLQSRCMRATRVYNRRRWLMENQTRLADS